MWNSLSLNFFSWNQIFSNFFCKNVTFTKFLSKKCERITRFSTLYCVHCVHTVWKLQKISHTFWQIFRETENNGFTKELVFPVRENFSFFYKVQMLCSLHKLISRKIFTGLLWKSALKNAITIFSVNSTFSLKNLLELISRKFLSVIAFYSTFLHCDTRATLNG